MSPLVSTQEALATSAAAAKKKPRIPLLVAITLLAALVGGAGWYYFFGRKPKVALTVGLSAKEGSAPRGLWSTGPNELLLFADGSVQMIDTAERKKRWSVQMPVLKPVDPAWQAAVNARFVRLQQWADELSLKRGRLGSPAEIKAFNTEAAKYHTELTAARTEAANPKGPAQPVPEPPVVAEQKKEEKKSEPPAPAFGADRSSVDKLKPVTDTGTQIIQERIKKRTAKLTAWRAALDVKKASAKTAFQKSAVTEEETRFAAEQAEQKKDEEKLEKRQEKPAPAVAAAEPEKAADESDESAGAGEEIANEKPMMAICSARLWVIDGHHAVAFDRATGAVKADIRLAGAALRVFSNSDAAIVVASAGSDAVQITKLTAAAPQSHYFATGRHEAAFSYDGGSVMPNVQAVRTEFSGAGGSLLRVEIRLKEKSIRTRDAIKPGSEKQLEATAGGSAAHSLDELKSMAALIQNDAARLNGTAVEHLDESTYEVTLSRPFESAAPPWSTTLKGRVQVLSTPTRHLVSAGTKLIAFGGANKPAWEATLGAPLPIHRGDSELENGTPWLEAGGKLFIADGAFLSAFDLKSGQAVWRLPSVGIRKIQVDAEGGLYVLSENLSVETLSYVNDASFHDAVPITMSIDSADGKIRWQVEKYQDLWASGKDVYVQREGKNAGDVEAQVFDPSKAVEARVKIYKLSRSSGKPLWEWFQPRRPHAVQVHGKSVALLFAGELQVIRSINW